MEIHKIDINKPGYDILSKYDLILGTSSGFLTLGFLLYGFSLNELWYLFQTELSSIYVPKKLRLPLIGAKYSMVKKGAALRKILEDKKAKTVLTRLF